MKWPGNVTKHKNCGYYLSVDGKDGADGDETVDVGGAVQRVEAHDVFTLEDDREKERVTHVSIITKSCSCL